MKFRIYAANKKDKVDKYKEKLQKHYNDIRVSGQPWLICCPMVRYDGKFAVPLAVDGYPGNDGDDGVVDDINPPVAEQMPEE